jgi:hypothetical protein
MAETISAILMEMQMVKNETTIQPTDMTPGPPVTRPVWKRVVMPVMTDWDNDVSFYLCLRRSSGMLTIMENEMPKLCIRLQSRLNSCLYPNSANMSSSASSTTSEVLLALDTLLSKSSRGSAAAGAVGGVFSAMAPLCTAPASIANEEERIDAWRLQRGGGGALMYALGASSPAIAKGSSHDLAIRLLARPSATEIRNVGVRCCRGQGVVIGRQGD